MIPALNNLTLLFLVLASAFWLIILCLLIKNKKSWARHLLFSPYVVLFILAFFFAIYDYSTGKATLYLDQTNRIDYFNEKDFDFDRRLYYHNYAGEHYGPLSLIGFGRFYMMLVNDFSLKCFVSAFGYQRNIYRGKFPGSNELRNAFRKETLKKIYLDSANIGFVRFKFKNETIILKGNQMYDPPTKTLDDYNGLEDVFTTTDSVNFTSTGKQMRKGSYLLILDKYYPLLFNVFDTSGIYKYQIIDSRNQKVISEQSLDKDN